MHTLTLKDPDDRDLAVVRNLKLKRYNLFGGVHRRRLCGLLHEHLAMNAFVERFCR